MSVRPLVPHLAFGILLAALLGAPSAAARGDLGVDRDACVLEVGPERVYFTAYQPDGAGRKFCEDLPELGPAIFVLDFAEPGLREMRVAFRLLRGSSGDAEATLAYLPPAIHPTGTFSYRYEFTRPGEYEGVVTADGANGEHWVARFPFTVAAPGLGAAPYYLIALAAALALLLLISRKRAAPRPRVSR